MRLEGKVAIISGGARGMGAVEARLFVQEGAKVVIGDILEEEGRRTVQDINETGGRALFERLDVTMEGDWRRVVEQTVGHFGGLDILVNNAGILHWASVEGTTLENWNRVMDVNSVGVFLGTKAVIPSMKRYGGGSIVNISSISGLGGGTNHAAYQASKGAVRQFTKATAIEYAKDGIRANSVHPGPIETDMLADMLADPEFRRERSAIIPLVRIGTAEDVAYGVLYLASEESSYVTGAELVIDGGWMAQ